MKLLEKVLICAILMMLPLSVGCSNIWHNLQPHRMMKLNSGPAPSSDPEFTNRTSQLAIQLVSYQNPSSDR